MSGVYGTCAEWMRQVWFGVFDQCKTELYVIGERDQELADGSLIKIGITNNPTRRLRQVQTGYPNPLHFKLLVPGDRRHESLLHHMWRHQRKTGEWFVYSQEIGEFINDADRANWLRLTSPSNVFLASLLMCAASGKPPPPMDELVDVAYEMSRVSREAMGTSQ